MYIHLSHDLCSQLWGARECKRNGGASEAGAVWGTWRGVRAGGHVKGVPWGRAIKGAQGARYGCAVCEKGQCAEINTQDGNKDITS